MMISTFRQSSLTYSKVAVITKVCLGNLHCMAENFHGRKISPRPAIFVLLKCFVNLFSPNESWWRNWRKFSPGENFSALQYLNDVNVAIVYLL